MPQVICCHICGNLGDALLLTTVVEALHAKYPHSKIYCYGSKPDNLSLWEYNPFIAGIIYHPQQVLSTPLAELSSIINNFEAEETFYTPGMCRLKPTLRQPRQHVIQVLCKLAGVTANGQRVRVYLSPEDEAFAKRALSAFGSRVIALHTTAYNCQNKNWYDDRWAEVVKRVGEWGYTVVQIGSQAEQAIAGTINMLGKTTIRQALAIVKHSALFMGVEAVFNHATSAFVKPSVVLFGASTPEVWGYEHNINLYKDLKCQPCMDLIRNNCPVKRCMEQITVEQVEEAVKQIIS